MRPEQEIEEMRLRAYNLQESLRDMKLQDQGPTYAESMAYAEGVEAGLLFAKGDAGSPFPR